jgi:hypothetical protein
MTKTELYNKTPALITLSMGRVLIEELIDDVLIKICSYTRLNDEWFWPTVVYVVEDDSDEMALQYMRIYKGIEKAIEIHW